MTRVGAVLYVTLFTSLVLPSRSAEVPWADSDKTEPAGLKYRTFRSATVRQDVSYLIYLPPDYSTATGKRYPAIYWLHGLGGSQRSGGDFIEHLDAAIKAGQTPAAIAVLVNGLRDSRYFDSFDGQRPVESVIIKDLIPHIDATYRTLARRESRAIEGFSMGGFGAARLGFKYPELFGAVSIMSGALLDTESVGTTTHPELFEKNFGGKRAYFHVGSPWVLADQNAGKIRSRMFVRIGIGEMDPLFERNLTYHEMLDRLGIAHEFFTVPGVAHNQKLFYEKLGASAFAFYREAFSGKPAYEWEIRQWRREREERLKSDTGWLTVAGLFWLKEGANRVGSDPSNDIVLPSPAPAHAGVFEFHNGKTTLQAAPGANITLNGQPVTTLEMTPDQSGSPAAVAIGDLTLFVIQRGERFAIRLKDRNSKLRREFAGLRSFPIRPEYRVEAQFVPYETPKILSITSVLGDIEKLPSPGYVSFKLAGRELRLEPVLEDDNELFFIFRDLTSGKETYPPGRFLYSEMPRQGRVILDFNKAYNPPCAFNSYTTCPLPPRQNYLPVRIGAGELAYGH